MKTKLDKRCVHCNYTAKLSDSKCVCGSDLTDGSNYFRIPAPNSEVAEYVEYLEKESEPKLITKESIKNKTHKLQSPIMIYRIKISGLSFLLYVSGTFILLKILEILEAI